MRLLMLFTLGFCSGSAFCAYLAWDQNALWLILAAVFFFLFVICVCLRKRAAVAAGVCLLGAAVSFLWYWGYDAYFLKPARIRDQTVSSCNIRVTDYSFDTSYGTAADGEIVLSERRYQVRFYLNEKCELKPGDRVQGDFRLRYTAAGGEKGASFHQSEGIFLLAYSKGKPTVYPADGLDARFYPAVLRKAVLKLLNDVFPADTAPFASALLIGEDDRLTYAENTALKISGIRHVVAVSGQHLVILLAAVMLLSGRSRKIACFVSIPISILFAAMAGFTPSILRACIMQLVMLGAFLIKREYDGPTALSFAVLLMIAANPLAVTSVSLQLSAGSIIGMFLYSSRIYRRIRAWSFFKRVKDQTILGKLLHWLIGSVSVTLSSMVITVPLSAIYFRTVSLIGVVTNLVTLWLITLVFYGIILCVALGAVWSWGAVRLGKLLSIPIRFILSVAKALSAVPGGCLYLRNEYIILAAIAAYGVLLLMLYWKQLRIWMGGCLIACILFLGLASSWMAPLQDPWRITVLDVGQGQSILLQSGQRTYMVDCGGDYAEGTADIAAETLLSMGITRLDGLILTHFDADHTCGVENLLSRIQVDTLFLPDDTEHADYALLSGKSKNAITVTQDLFIAWSSAKITVFSANGGTNSNEKSLCVLFQSGNCDILITGDRPISTELMLLFYADIPQLDYLVAGHHGARTSTSDALLRRLKPETVLISAGENNRFDHPHQEVLERLLAHGCKILRTDLLGTIVIRG